MQGIGTPNIITQQTIFHIDLFIRLTASDSLSGQILQMTLEKLQLEVGSGIPGFSLIFEEYE